MASQDNDSKGLSFETPLGQKTPRSSGQGQRPPKANGQSVKANGKNFTLK